MQKCLKREMQFFWREGFEGKENQM